MIALLSLIAAVAVAKPSGDVLYCPLTEKPARREAVLRLRQNPSWRVRFLDYVGPAKQLQQKRDGFNRIAWQDRRGRPYRADIQWSNSWGSTGVVATVEISNLSERRGFEGNCYLNKEAAA
ncbi:MAG TPA: hypothetical protein VKC17_08240 [Sphingomicrobium sp.]|nr:hypothetical protein [Sphingomicrobium sp.]